MQQNFIDSRLTFSHFALSIVNLLLFFPNCRPVFVCLLTAKSPYTHTHTHTHKHTCHTLSVGLFSESGPELVGLIAIVTKAEPLFLDVVWKAIVDENLFPNAETPETETEYACEKERQCSAMLALLVRSNHLLAQSHAR